LLGRSPSAPPVPDDDHDTRVHQSGRVPRFDSDPVDPDDDGVFTSASRPMIPPPPSFVDDLSLGDDQVAPPPLPHPAIVRRTPAPGVPRPTPGPIPRIDESRITPSRGHDASMFAEQTRVADHDYEGRAVAAPAPLGTDDAYDDIEIGTSSSDEAAPVA